MESFSPKNTEALCNIQSLTTLPSQEMAKPDYVLTNYIDKIGATSHWLLNSLSTELIGVDHKRKYWKLILALT